MLHEDLVEGRPRAGTPPVVVQGLRAPQRRAELGVADERVELEGRSARPGPGRLALGRRRGLLRAPGPCDRRRRRTGRDREGHHEQADPHAGRH